MVFRVSALVAALPVFVFSWWGSADRQVSLFNKIKSKIFQLWAAPSSKCSVYSFQIEKNGNRSTQVLSVQIRNEFFSLDESFHILELNKRWFCKASTKKKWCHVAFIKSRQESQRIQQITAFKQLPQRFTGAVIINKDLLFIKCTPPSKYYGIQCSSLALNKFLILQVFMKFSRVQRNILFAFLTNYMSF